MSHKTVVGPVMIVRDNKEDVCLFCCDEFRLKRHQRRRNNLHTMPKNRRAACSSQKTAPTFQILTHDDCFRRFSEKRTILSSVRLACRGMKTTIYYEIQRHSRVGLLWFVYRRPWSLLDFFQSTFSPWRAFCDDAFNRLQTIAGRLFSFVTGGRCWCHVPGSRGPTAENLFAISRKNGC